MLIRVRLYSWLQTTVDMGMCLTHEMILCQGWHFPGVVRGRRWLPRGSRAVLGRGRGCLVLALPVQAHMCSELSNVGLGLRRPPKSPFPPQQSPPQSINLSLPLHPVPNTNPSNPRSGKRTSTSYPRTARQTQPPSRRIPALSPCPSAERVTAA